MMSLSVLLILSFGSVPRPTDKRRPRLYSFFILVVELLRRFTLDMSVSLLLAVLARGVLVTATLVVSSIWYY